MYEKETDKPYALVILFFYTKIGTGLLPYALHV